MRWGSMPISIRIGVWMQKASPSRQCKRLAPISPTKARLIVLLLKSAGCTAATVTPRFSP